MNDKELESKCDAIDAVLSVHVIGCRVKGGAVTPRSVLFTVSRPIPKVVGLTESLGQALGQALGLPETAITISGSRIIVNRTDKESLDLAGLIEKLSSDKGRHIPPITAVLGLCDEGAPLLVRLTAESVGNVLICGPDGCGKSSLLRTIGVSLAALNYPRLLRLVSVGKDLSSLSGLPNALEYNYLDLTRRIVYPVRSPHVVVLVDDIGYAIDHDIATILREGHEAGVYVVAAGKRISSAGFGTLINSLGDPGYFEATSCGDTIKFTAAYSGPNGVKQ